MTEDQKKVRQLYQKLLKSRTFTFPVYREKLHAPPRRGVYIIYNQRGTVVHVGRTPTAKRGIAQRLEQHMSGASSFTIHHLKKDGSKLRGRYKFRYLVVKVPKLRAYLEAYAIGKLCPKHIGLG